MTLRSTPAPLVATLSLTNAGDRQGAEVVQLYVRDLESTLDRPDKELRAFEKLDLAPGESTQVRFDLGERAFAAWDPTLKAWTIEPGDFELLAGPSSRDLRASARVTIR